ncbi:protein DGCR6-like [Eriocheir sinensis]|uniref:protein DGCR6-like n=1 Tax=Eriocheir sinensis TaxID=95602 RepID=UPI0021C8559D|nr:protein DGCR6-like [Eriocheir sinensis]XP_050734376.1 protein DGCR6-like [Eriocheir sinensis]XP_050734377.1 protein DGCR6-like [Eriocheir sinensis]XP_050734378.1 protein DGCR6-like [Eriocheir sinensis]
MNGEISNSSDTQERLYKMLEKLQNLARDIPPKFQQRLPYDLLSSLANCLLDNTSFEIMQELAELQHMTEKILHKQHAQMINKHKTERDNLIKCHKEELTAAERQGKTHVLSRLPRLHQDQLAELNTRHAQETDNTHLFIQNVLDQKVEEQQSTLQQARVPGFHVTSNPMEIKVQMYIMGFIMVIGGIKIPH